MAIEFVTILYGLFTGNGPNLCSAAGSLIREGFCALLGRLRIDVWWPMDYASEF